MTILSIVVCNSSTKIIFARQFIEMTRKELEEHVVLFNRTLSQETETTSIDTEKNRYLYIHNDSLYIVLITTKDSNVIEDMEVLKLAYRLISDLCGGKTVDTIIIEKGFEIALGLDDIITFGIYEGINMLQVKQLLQMDSSEEKEFKRQQQQKEKNAKEQLNIKMREIELLKQSKSYFSDSIGSEKYDTMKLGSESNTNITSSINAGLNLGLSASMNENTQTDSNSNKKVLKSKGLSLGKKKNDLIIEDSIRKNSDSTDTSGVQANLIKSNNNTENILTNNNEVKFNPLDEPIRFEIEEKLKGEISKDGEFKKLEVKGEGYVTLLNPNKKNFFIAMNSELKPKFTTIKIDKKVFSEKNIIIAEDRNEGFTNNIKTCIFKYTLKLSEDDLPFTFNCFTSSSGSLNIINFTCEYNVNSDKIKHVNNLIFAIKASPKSSFKVNDSEGSINGDSLKWSIQELNENKQPSIEIKTSDDPSSLFPINIIMNLNYVIAGITAKAFDDKKEELLLAFKTVCDSQDFKISYD